MIDAQNQLQTSGEDRWMTLREIGEEFKATSEAVRLWITRGELPAMRAGRKWIVRRSDLLRFIRAGAGSDPAGGHLEAGDDARPSDREGALEDGRPPAPGTRLTASAAGVAERAGG